MGNEVENTLATAIERLAAATELLEQVMARQSALTDSAEASIGRIVATVETRREAELEEKLAAAELKIAELQAASVSAGRKTLPAVGASLYARHDSPADAMEASALDAALVSLSVEQRIAVKAQLMRAGMVR